jgi:hypothetical protein
MNDPRRAFGSLPPRDARFMRMHEESVGGMNDPRRAFCSGQPLFPSFNAGRAGRAEAGYPDNEDLMGVAFSQEMMSVDPRMRFAWPPADPRFGMFPRSPFGHR